MLRLILLTVLSLKQLTGIRLSMHKQMLMFLTRLGFDSKCVVTGDLTQIDLPPNKASGLLEAKD